MTKIFQIPRREVSVRILLDRGERMDGVLFAASLAPGGGPGLLSDRLNDSTETFIPLATGEGRSLLNKERIVAVELVSGREEAEHASEGAEHQVPVHVKLTGGKQLEGRVYFTMPQGKGRIVDYLNEAPRFVPVVHEETVTMVNRSYIVMLANESE